MPPLTVPHEYAVKASRDHDRHPQGLLSRRSAASSRRRPAPGRRARRPGADALSLADGYQGGIDVGRRPALHPGGRARQGHQRGHAAAGRRADRDVARAACRGRRRHTVDLPGGRAARLGGRRRPGYGRARRRGVRGHPTSGRRRRRRLRGEHAARHVRDHRARPARARRPPPWSAPCRPRTRPRGAPSSLRPRAPSSRWSPPSSSPRPSTVRSWPASIPTLPTDELVGKRVQYVYSRTEVYEHIYLNENLYTWQCLRGQRARPGRHAIAATTARSTTSSTSSSGGRRSSRRSGVVLVDWRLKRSNGKLFGYESSDFGALSTTAIASRATLLNITTHS